MPEPMKFCASMTKCNKAYTVGKPGRVKIALDRDPLDAGKLDNLMLFLKDRLSPEDFSKFTDLIDDLQDDAEQANPSAEMATDALPVETRRRIRREYRNVRLGLDSRPTGRIAQDAAGFASRFPEASRIQSDPTPAVHHGYTQPKPRVAMDAAHAKSLDERFGTGRIGHAS